MQGHFPANRVQQLVCARLAKGTELHCRRPRGLGFAGLCLVSTYSRALPGTLVSKVPSIYAFSITTCLNILKQQYLKKNIRFETRAAIALMLSPSRGLSTG